MYEKLHNKFTSTYSRGISRKSFSKGEKSICASTSHGATAACSTYTNKKETRANKCLLCKQIIFKLFHQKFPLHWLLFIVFILFLSLFSIIPYAAPYHPSIHATLRHSRAEVKKCTLTISIYAKHIIALYMITIFRNLSSKLRH